jgi:hypothetical protein
MIRLTSVENWYQGCMIRRESQNAVIATWTGSALNWAHIDSTPRILNAGDHSCLEPYLTRACHLWKIMYQKHENVRVWRFYHNTRLCVVFHPFCKYLTSCTSFFGIGKKSMSKALKEIPDQFSDLSMISHADVDDSVDVCRKLISRLCAYWYYDRYLTIGMNRVQYRTHSVRNTHSPYWTLISLCRLNEN